MRLALLSILLLFGLRSKTEELNVRAYLPSCTGNWYIEHQGTENDSDYVDLRCQNTDEEGEKSGSSGLR